MTIKDTIFKEEQEALGTVVNKIEVELLKLQKKKTKIEDELDGFIVVDATDHANKLVLLSDKRRYTEEINELKPTLNETYFGRLDLENQSNEVNTTYIGKKEVMLDFKQYVADWRTPVAECFYKKRDKEFLIRNQTYLLSLRRAFNIKNGQLLDYTTEYDNNEELYKDIIDPFLIQVIKDKRRQNRLSDIIKTIQENQNDIIRLPLEDSFAVQGCAGSGKTMILLHRLSYLIYNNDFLDLSKIKVLTPNPIFNLHINDLSEELGLNTIKRLSMEEYYASLINSLSSGLTVNSVTASEKSLKSELLSEIYSDEAVLSFEELYENEWMEVIYQLIDLGIKQDFRNFSMPFPKSLVYNQSLYTFLDKSVKDCLKQIDAHEKEINSLKEIIIRSKSSIEKNILDKEEYIIEKDKVFNSLSQKIKKQIKFSTESIKKAELSISNKKNLINNLSNQLNELNQVKTNEIDSIKYLSIDSITSINDEIGKQISNITADLINEYQLRKNELFNTPAYNIVKRNRIRRLIEGIEVNYQIVANSILKEIIDEQKTIQTNKMLEVEKIKKRIEELQILIKEDEITLKNFNKNLLSLELEENYILNPSNYPSSTTKTFTFELDELRRYSFLIDTLNSIDKSLKHFEKQISASEEKLIELSNKYDIENYKKKFDKYKNTIQRLSFGKLTTNVYYNYLMQLYKKHQVKYTKTNYRHKLIYKLLLCTYYFPVLKNKDSFLNFDEAQDISTIEYKLIRKIMGDECIFNLYGDVNQLVYDFKGISDWSDIPGVEENVYVLNENYRNTLQITEYCNNKLGFEVFPIGINGEEIIEASTPDALSWISSKKRSETSSRCAIIFKHGKKNIENSIKQYFSEDKISTYKVDDSKISILSVEDAKGLEFDHVVVFSDSMHENEQYISFTRSLQGLCVVHDQFAAEKQIESEEEVNPETLDFATE